MESLVLLAKHLSSGLSEEAGRGHVSKLVQVGSRANKKDGSSQDIYHSKVTSRKKKHSSRSTESYLLCPFEEVCWIFGRPHIDLFVTRVNTKLPIYVSPVLDPMTWKQDAFQHS